MTILIDRKFLVVKHFLFFYFHEILHYRIAFQAEKSEKEKSFKEYIEREREREREREKILDFFGYNFSAENMDNPTTQSHHFETYKTPKNRENV